MTLEKLYKIILDRKKKMPKGSYVASLFQQGKDRIAQKVGEEAVEVVIAAKGKDRKRIIAEMADLWFHSLILLASKEVTHDEVLQELEKRRTAKRNK